MNLAVPLPTALPTPPGGGARGLPPADPAHTAPPFAGLLGEQRLALASAGEARVGRKTDDGTATDGPSEDLAEPAAPAAAEARPADNQAATDATSPDTTRPEATPMLDWFATWQPEPAVARGLPVADAAAHASTEPAPTANHLTAIASADGRGAPGRRPGVADIAADAIAEARGRLALRAASHDALQARAQDEAGRAEHPAETLQSTTMQSEGEHLLAKDMTPARADLPVAEARNTDAAATPPAALPAPQAAAPPAAGGAAPVLTLATPLGSPDFSQALAAQLTTLARDGVHEARLQLNPAEMGPIAVQIVVDGSQAQVDFAAAQAATRQALEASLPSLAAALQTLGLTLSGGGVFEQGTASHDERPGEPGARGPRRIGATGDSPAVVGQPVALRARAGLLDLYA